MSFNTGKEAFFGGAKALLPAAPGVIPFGLVTGVTAIEQGLSPGTTIGMTLLFYAGSAQMAALQLLRNDALPLIILVTVLVINLRFLMYSASLAPHFHRLPLRWKVIYGGAAAPYSLENPRIWAALVAVLVAWKSRNILFTLVAGMGTLWALQYLA